MKEEHSHQTAAKEDRSVRIQKEEALVVTDHVEALAKTARDHADLSARTQREELSVATDHVEVSERTMTDHAEASARIAKEEASAAAEGLLQVAEADSTLLREA